jgi:RimJ/RimL family protein N-acetyltransferase
MIRRVESDDWERLRDVRLRALASDPDAFLVTVEEARTFTEERWRARAEPSEDGVTFAYEQHGVFDGMVSGFIDDDPQTVILVAMWVAPELRGTGVAQDLVQCVVEWSRRRGCVRVVLSVEGANIRAARLYEKCGFVEIDVPPSLPYDSPVDSRFYAYAL